MYRERETEGGVNKSQATMEIMGIELVVLYFCFAFIFAFVFVFILSFILKLFMVHWYLDVKEGAVSTDGVVIVVSVGLRYLFLLLF